MFDVPVRTILPGDKIRLRSATDGEILLAGVNYYLVKTDAAPDGSRVLWLSRTPPEDKYAHADLPTV